MSIDSLLFFNANYGPPLMSEAENPRSASHPGVIVLGSVNVDLVVKTSRLPAPGETVVGGEFYRAVGGKGANQAVAAARCSPRPVALVGAVGDDDLGRESRVQLETENLDCRRLKTVANTATGVALITVDAQGENAISVASGANACLSPEDVAALEDELFEHARVFLTNLESPIETVVAGLQRARRAGLITILNPAPADGGILDRAVLEFVDILTPNRVEAEKLLEVRLGTLTDAPQALRMFHDRGVRQVVVTLGAQGAWIVTTVEATAIEAWPVEPVDATAAGDAFNGALAALLGEQVELSEACRWANAAGALAVTRRGAQPSLPNREEIERFLDEGS